jgi:hypothetical protein
MTGSATESIGYCELKQQKPWFDEECAKLLDERKEAKLQWLQNPNQITGNKQNNVSCETNRTLRRKRNI